MASDPPESSSEGSKAVPQQALRDPVVAILVDAGLQPGPGLQECSALAAGAQFLRHANRQSDRELVTRSTFLWALARLHAEVRSALRAGGVELGDLARILGISQDPEPLDTQFELDADLERAIQSYVEARTPGDLVGTAEMAEAIIIHATAEEGSGLLGQRLRELGADSVAILQAMRPTSVEPAAGEGPLLQRVRDVSHQRFGVEMPAGTARLAPYFPRDVDAELDDALTAGARMVLVVAPAFSGSMRSVYEALRRVRPDDSVLVASELTPVDQSGTGPRRDAYERLLGIDADLVWIRNLRRMVDDSPSLLEWLRRRREAIEATLVAVLRPEDEGLIAELALPDARVVRMDGRLSNKEQSRAEDLYGRQFLTISDVSRAAAETQLRLRANHAADTFDASGLLSASSDDLRIRADIDRLAVLIASKQVSPPLSIGLFGQWGSGKSFLMHQLKLKVKDLADRSRGTKDESSSVFCSEVVPVDFNAWQYAHGSDLWASLINRVFEAIRDHLGGDHLDAIARRDQAAAALAQAKQQGPAELYGFVADRSNAAEYRQHLGMAPIIRDDLKLLAAMAEKKGGAPGIERVVIFIDDLDRCPAAEVVRVLEAVNLLCGFELFVVVVALDSRWLIRSLEKEFSEVFDETDESAPTPRNYLEKIIQIPFWLRPMRGGGFGRLITTLAGDVDDGREVREATGVGTSRSQPARSPAPDPPSRGDAHAAPKPTAQELAAGDVSPVDADLNLEALRITQDELAFMHGCSALVRTPRAAKRFLNTYQLLRVGVRDVKTFLDEEQFKPVLVLLALMSGTSNVDDKMVAELRGMSEPDFQHFLASRSTMPWNEIASACADLPVALLTSEVVREWLPNVARYSFHPAEL